jgi:peroxiredoxin family protein
VERKKRVAIIASKGTMDMAYPPLIVATTAASMGWEVGIFFTFYGLDIINKNKVRKLKVPPLANPAMPMPVPNIIGAIPGMTALATWMMKRMMKKQGMPPVAEMLDLAKKLGVRLFGCTTTMGIMGVGDSDMVEGVENAGAATFLDYAVNADTTIFV